MEITDKQREANAQAMAQVAEQINISPQEMTLACLDLMTLAFHKEISTKQDNESDEEADARAEIVYQAAEDQLNKLYDLLENGPQQLPLDTFILINATAQALQALIAEL